MLNFSEKSQLCCFRQLYPQQPKMFSLWHAQISQSQANQVMSRVARFSSDTKTGKIYQITMKYSKWPQNISNGPKIGQITIKYTNKKH
jgi:hypothetical protein